MEQLRQILSQMALNLELNIAMCDKIEDHENRLTDVEARLKAQTDRLSALYTRHSELLYATQAKAYEERKAKKNGQ